MATPLINLSDDSLFGNSQGGSAPRRGLNTSSQRINLNDDAMFKTSEEARSADVKSGKYVSIFDQEAKIEAPKRGLGRMIDDTITSVIGTNKANPEDISPEGIARVRAEGAQAQQQVAQRRAELGTNDPDRGYAMQTFDSAAAGMANMVGATMEYAGRQFGIKKMEELGKKAQIDGAALTPEEQDTLQKVAGGVGSALPIVAGGMLTGGGLLAAGATTGTALLGASAVGAALEAPSIAQEAFEGALKETGNEARAETQGYKAAALNLPISFIMNRIGIFGGGGGRALQTGKAVLAEGTEEGIQKGLTNYLGYQPTGEGVSEDALIGGLTGGVLKQVTYTPDKPEVKGDKPATEETGNLSGDEQTGTTEAPAQPGSDLPEGVSLLGFQEVYQTLRTKPAVAAVLYQEATTPEQKEIVRRAVDRAEIQREFQEALGDANLLSDARAEMESFPEFTDSIAASLTKFVSDMPPSNIYKPNRRAPTEQEVNNEFDRAWEDASYVASLEAEADAIASERQERQARRPGFEPSSVPGSTPVTTPSANEMESLVSQAESQFTPPSTEGMTSTEQIEASLPESLRGARLNDSNRFLLEAYFEEALGTILPRRPTKTRARALAKIQREMEMVGFKPEQIRSAIDTGSFDSASALADVVAPPAQVTTAPTEARAEQVKAPATPAPLTAPAAAPIESVESFAPDAGPMTAAEQTQPTATEAPAAEESRVNPEIDRAKDDLRDAAAELADVFADVVQVRKNITGQQYTAKDLPPAIAKVMTRLADLGYVKFKDMVRELMKRMRANKDWAPLADQVTPFMLRQAYKKLPKFEGKDADRDVDTIKGGEVATLIAEGREKTKAEEAKDAEDEVNTAGMSFSKEQPKKPVKKQPKAEQESDEVDTPAEYGLGEKYQLPKGKQASLGLGRFKRDDDTPQMKTLRSRLEGIVRNASQIKFFEDTILMLQKQITDIESQMKALDTLTVKEGGKVTTFRARREEDENPGLWATYDMNAYDRFIDGQLPEKPTTKMALMDQRRRLVEELERVRDKSAASRARLYMRSMSRMMDQMMTVTQNAMSAGMPAGQARSVFNEFYQAISFRDTKPAPEAEVVEADQDQDAQVDIFEGAKVAMGIVSDFRDKQITQRQLDELIDRGVRDGDFTYLDVANAFRAYNMSVPRGVMDVSSQLAVRKRLSDFLEENGGSTTARQEWLVSMDKVVTANPGSIGTRFTAAEVAFYNMWKQDRKALKERRKVTSDMREGKTAEVAFPNLLFSRFRLSQVRNPDLINDKNTALAVRAVTGADPEAAYFEDVAYALRRRPDLKDDILESMTAEEGRLFNSWVEAKKRAIAQESRMLAKAPAFTTLRNMDSAETILASRPLADTRTVVDDTSPSDLEQLYVQVANAELSELPAVMDAISRLNSVLVGRVDPDTGEILTDSQAEQIAADFVDSLAQKAVMGSVYSATGAEMSQFGASTGFSADAPAGLKRGEFGFGETAEDAAAAMRASGPQNTTDLTAEEQLQDEMISEIDLMEAGREMNEAGTEEDAEAESDATSPQEAAATEREQGSRKAAVPDSLTGEEYRFKRAPFSGELTNSIVAEHVFGIVSKWTGAPRINVIPNVQMLPEGIREQVMAKLSKDSGAAGLFVNGEVYIFSDHISSLSDAEFTLFHETYGHYGMRAFLGAKFDSFLELAYNTNARIRAEADALMASKPIGKLEAIDEVISDMAASNEPVGLVKRWVGQVIAGLRQIGMNRVAGWISTKTDAEIGYTLMMARKAVQEGAPTIFNGAPDEVRLAEARLPYEMFSSRGGETTAYARYNPITQTYAVFTATGGNLRGGWNTQVLDSFEDAVEIMRKSGKVERRLRSGLYIDNKIPSDLQKIPEFRIATDELSLTSKEGLKNYARLIKRNSIIFFQNEYKAVHEVAEYLRAKGRLSDAFDPTRDLEGLHERRTAAKLENLQRRFVKPLLQLAGEAGKLGADADMINKYLVAKHAEERNKHIAKINKGMPDGGSGMKTKEANDFLKSIQNEKFMPKLEEISLMLKQLSDQKLAMMKEAGLISHDEYMARAQYKNYVNLSGVNEGLDAFDDLAVLAGSSKFSTRKDKRAMGRGDMASDVLARTIQSAEAAVLNAGKNRVKQKILAMLEVNYDPDFVSINKQAYKRVLDENGEVTEKMDESYIRNKNVMVVHINGRPTTIEFKKTGKGTFADAIHGAIYPAEADWAVARALGQYNRIVGQMLTTWNPVWVLVNFVRDAQTLYFNSVADKRVTRQMAKDMVKSIPSAMKATFHYATEGRRGNSADMEMIRAFREMREAGGATSFLNLQGLEKQVSAIEDMIRPQDKNAFVKTGQFLADKLEEFNIPIELAPRLAAYKVMRDNGYSKEEAAQYAGEITVNFNMRGSSRFMRNMYLFFNPAVQGSAKLVKLASENPKTFGKIALGMAAVGFISSVIGRAMGGEDEDGIDKIDKVPVFKRATSLILSPDVPGAAIPVPYGWNAFFAAGVFMADTLWAQSQSVSTTTKRIAQAAFEGFSPIGSAGLDSQTALGTLFKGLSPTAALPLLEIMLNENRFGAPIVKEAGLFGGGKRPDAEMAFDSVSPISAGIFKGLNRATGGDAVNPGVIDINPGVVDHLISSYLPGLAAETYKTASWATKNALGYDTKSAAIPLVDRLTAKVPESYDYGMYRRAKEYVATKYDDFKLNPERRDKILTEFPGLGGAKGVLDTTDSRIQDLREYRKNVEADKTMSREEKVKLINESRAREKEIVTRAVRVLLDTSPALKPVLIKSE